MNSTYSCGSHQKTPYSWHVIINNVICVADHRVTNNYYWYVRNFQLKAMQETNCFLAGLLKANKTIILISVYRLKQYLHKYTCEHTDYYT